MSQNNPSGNGGTQTSRRSVGKSESGCAKPRPLTALVSSSALSPILGAQRKISWYVSPAMIPPPIGPVPEEKNLLWAEMGSFHRRPLRYGSSRDSLHGPRISQDVRFWVSLRPQTATQNVFVDKLWLQIRCKRLKAYPEQGGRVKVVRTGLITLFLGSLKSWRTQYDVKTLRVMKFDSTQTFTTLLPKEPALLRPFRSLFAEPCKKYVSDAIWDFLAK